MVFLSCLLDTAYPKEKKNLKLHFIASDIAAMELFQSLLKNYR